MVHLLMSAASGVRRPPQVAPLRRPEVIAPHTTVDIQHGDLITALNVRLELMHGANYNDPSPWSPQHYELRRASR